MAQISLTERECMWSRCHPPPPKDEELVRYSKIFLIVSTTTRIWIVQIRKYVYLLFCAFMTKVIRRLNPSNPRNMSAILVIFSS